MQICEGYRLFKNIFVNKCRENKMYFHRATRHSLAVGHFTGVKMETHGSCKYLLCWITIYI